MKLYNKQPWESALTEKTVYASGGMITQIGKLETDVKLISVRYPYIRESTRSGYLRDGWYATIPYSGRYGEGYIIAQPKSRSSVACTFYLDRPKRGEADA